MSPTPASPEEKGLTTARFCAAPCSVVAILSYIIVKSRYWNR